MGSIRGHEHSYEELELMKCDTNPITSIEGYVHYCPKAHFGICITDHAGTLVERYRLRWKHSNTYYLKEALKPCNAKKVVPRQHPQLKQLIGILQNFERSLWRTCYRNITERSHDKNGSDAPNLLPIKQHISHCLLFCCVPLVAICWD